MHSPHTPRVIDVGEDACVVECPQCREGRSVDVPIGIGIPMRDRITAELLAGNHRDEHRNFVRAADVGAGWPSELVGGPVAQA
jgi:hypothetical protein